MNKQSTWIVFVLLLGGLVSLLSFKNNKQPNVKADYTVSIAANQVEGLISPNLMGFNIVYVHERDAQWQKGEGHIPKLLKPLGTKQLRWPGGTVATFYHWDKLTGQGWSDIWSPNFNLSKNTDPATYTDLDEYLAITKKLNLDPLVGINMGSGKKNNRVQDGIDEAKRLMNHCLDKGVRVKYFFLDNEPYHETANYKFTAEEYAGQINLYATEMKKIDPNIKTIVNTHPSNDAYTKTLIKEAGRNIDYVDVHNYWKFNNASFASWKAEPKMTQQGRFPYSEQRGHFKKIFQELGYPDVELVILEWNIGPNVAANNVFPTPAEAALMVSEQFTQYIQEGLHMACFWPLSWPEKPRWASRVLLNAQDGYKPNKVYDMFALYTDVMGQQKIKSAASADRLINVAAKSKDGKDVWVYLINKNLDKASLTVDLSLTDFQASGYKAVSFAAADREPDKLDIKEIKFIKKDASHFSVTMPQFSFVKITFKK